jgi:hypothetical protein
VIGVLLLATWIELHGPDDQRIFVNPDQIVSIREPRGMEQGHFAKGTRCLLTTSDGKYLTVRESCAQIKEAVK